MSWIVQHLLINSEVLHAQSDFESDEYNNLLVVEKKIEELLDKGLLSERELNILNVVASGDLYGDLDESLGLNRRTVYKIFNDICEKISFSIGDVFTDAGYISYMAEKYNLTARQIEKLENFITSNLKHKIMRSPYND